MSGSSAERNFASSYNSDSAIYRFFCKLLLHSSTSHKFPAVFYPMSGWSAHRGTFWSLLSNTANPVTKDFPKLLPHPSAWPPWYISPTSVLSTEEGTFSSLLQNTNSGTAKVFLNCLTFYHWAWPPWVVYLRFICWQTDFMFFPIKAKSASSTVFPEQFLHRNAWPDLPDVSHHISSLSADRENFLSLILNKTLLLQILFLSYFHYPSPGLDLPNSLAPSQFVAERDFQVPSSNAECHILPISGSSTKKGTFFPYYQTQRVPSPISFPVLHPFSTSETDLPAVTLLSQVCLWREEFLVHP